MWLHVGDMLVLSEHMPLDAGLSVPRGVYAHAQAHI